MTHITEIRGTITTSDGETREFRIFPDGSGQEGNTREKLGDTVDAVGAMRAAVDEYMQPDDDDDDPRECSYCAYYGERGVQATAAHVAKHPINVDASADESMSWSEVAERDAAGFCPSSPGYNEPHITTDGVTCDECGAEVGE